MDIMVKSTDINIKHLKELNWATSGKFTMWVTVTAIWLWASLLVRCCSRVLLRCLPWATPVFPSRGVGYLSSVLWSTDLRGQAVLSMNIMKCS